MRNKIALVSSLAALGALAPRGRLAPRRRPPPPPAAAPAGSSGGARRPPPPSRPPRRRPRPPAGPAAVEAPRRRRLRRRCRAGSASTPTAAALQLWGGGTYPLTDGVGLAFDMYAQLRRHPRGARHRSGHRRRAVMHHADDRAAGRLVEPQGGSPRAAALRRPAALGPIYTELWVQYYIVQRCSDGRPSNHALRAACSSTSSSTTTSPSVPSST